MHSWLIAKTCRLCEWVIKLLEQGLGVLYGNISEEGAYGVQRDHVEAKCW
jgi:hypothetical protein